MSFFFISCSEDGEDGDSYLQLGWGYTPESFQTADDQFPAFSASMRDVDYLSTPGEHAFTYESWLYETYVGTYTLTFNPGEEAPDPFTDGEKGESECHRLYLGLSGPDFYNWYCTDVTQSVTVEDDSYTDKEANYIKDLEKIEKLSLAEIKDKYSKINRVEYDLASISIDKSDADVVVKTGRLGNYTYELVYKKGKIVLVILKG